MIAETIQYNNICDLCKIKDRYEYWYYLSFVPEGYSQQYVYCRFIKDRSLLWKSLAKAVKAYPSAVMAAVSYCQHVKDRAEIRQAILETNHHRTPEALFLYCYSIKDRPSFYKKLFDIKTPVGFMYQIEYIKHVKDREEK